MKNNVTGILVLWKPKGMTSFSAVREVTKIFETKKAGHTGTLDPDVDGILPICLGQATKLVEYLTADQKTYTGEVTLGYSTTTEDASGEIVEQKEISEDISAEKIRQVLKSLEGELIQTPPMYSAVRVKGKRLYEYARKGITVERPSRTVNIYAISMDQTPKRTAEGYIRFPFTVTCSKGTYIRTLSVMIGELLGYPAHMSALTRTASGAFTGGQSVTLDELEEMKAEDRFKRLITIEEAVDHFPKFIVDKDLEKRVLNGAKIEKSTFNVDESPLALYNQLGECLALYKDHATEEGVMKPEKMFAKTENLSN